MFIFKKSKVENDDRKTGKGVHALAWNDSVNLTPFHRIWTDQEFVSSKNVAFEHYISDERNLYINYDSFCSFKEHCK